MADSAGNLVDQWYCVEGPEKRGPAPPAEIVRPIQARSLPSSALVAQAGWQTWSPAATALTHLLKMRLRRNASPKPMPFPDDDALMT
ncbi:MAG TPA: GYF domain-containing protein [Bryobacteraceae bacterium]|nr:GYF domain-containing protein [Bryobacteraceae bacterium]